MRLPMERCNLEALKDELQRPPFNRWLAAAPLSIADGGDAISVCLPFRPEFSYDATRNVFHGGVIAALIDMAGYAAVAIRHAFPTPTLSLHIEYLAPAMSAKLIANARVRKLGRSVSRVDVDIVGDGALFAIGRGVFNTREIKK
jgi:uncharacterized protein (TIGR00369 family)